MNERITSPAIQQLDSVFGEALKNNHYALLFDLKEVFRTRKLNEYEWSRVSLKGAFNLCDYDTGTFCVSTRILANVPNKHTEKDFYTYSVMVGVFSADDHMWRAWSKELSLIKAKELVQKLLPLMDELYILPTEEELNTKLMPFGLYGTCD